MDLTAIFILVILCILLCVCNLIISIVFASRKTKKDLDTSTGSYKKFYVTCLCSKPNKARIYRSFVMDWFTDSENPSQDQIMQLRSEVLAANPEYNECVVLFFSKING